MRIGETQVKQCIKYTTHAPRNAPTKSGISVCSKASLFLRLQSCYNCSAKAIQP